VISIGFFCPYCAKVRLSIHIHIHIHIFLQYLDNFQLPFQFTAANTFTFFLYNTYIVKIWARTWLTSTYVRHFAIDQHLAVLSIFCLIIAVPTSAEWLAHLLSTMEAPVDWLFAISHSVCYWDNNRTGQDSTVKDRVQYRTVQYSTVQYSTVQDSTIQDTTVQDSTVQYSTVQYSTVQDSTIQDTTVQDSTVQDSTVQDSTVKDRVQNSTV